MYISTRKCFSDALAAAAIRGNDILIHLRELGVFRYNYEFIWGTNSSRWINVGIVASYWLYKSREHLLPEVVFVPVSGFHPPYAPYRSIFRACLYIPGDWA